MHTAFRLFLKIAYVWATILIMNASLSFAQSPLPQNVRDDAIILAETIEELTYIAHQTAETPDEISPLTNYRSQILGAFDRSNDLNLKELISDYRNIALEKQSETDVQLSNYYTQLEQIYIHDSFESPERINTALSILDEMLESSDWIILHQAHSLAAVIHSYAGNFPIALQHSRESLKMYRYPQQSNICF